MLIGIRKSILHTLTIKSPVTATDMVKAAVADSVKGANVMDTEILRRAI